MKKFNLVFVIVLLLGITTGCYRNRFVESHQVGLQLDDGVSIAGVVGPGRYSNSGYWADFVAINASNITTAWQDPSLVTRDKQPIGLTMSVTFSRKRDTESITNLYTRYNNEAKDDASLTNLVLSKVPAVAKTITTRYTLDQMLGVTDDISGTAVLTFDRTALATEVFNLLDSELDQIFVELASVEIVDIAPSPEYLTALNAKAQASIGIEVAASETKRLTEQLAQEKAQTLIELERADRENKVNAAKAQAYEESPQLLELRKLELLGDVLGKGDVVIYVPEGADITSVLTQVPVVPVE